MSYHLSSWHGNIGKNQSIYWHKGSEYRVHKQKSIFQAAEEAAGSGNR